METLKTVSVYESDFNTMTLIAKKEGLLYSEGNRAGKMVPAKVIHLLISNWIEVTRLTK